MAESDISFPKTKKGKTKMYNLFIMMAPLFNKRCNDIN
jgi:hypothetical protein